MVYRTLKIPVVLFFEILETENYHLLTDEVLPDDELRNIWEELYNDFNERIQDESGKNHFNIRNKVNHLISKYKSVIIAVDCLSFEYDEDLIQMLKQNGFVLTKNNLHEDLINIKNDANGLLVRANTFSAQLPKESNVKVSIYDTLTSYTMILGYDLDFEKISVLKFLSLKKQVQNKIKQLEKNNG